MLASSSPLTILDYAITKMDFSLVPFSKQVEDVHEVFSSYEIDIDFDIYVNKAFIRVTMSAKINQGKIKKEGYSICAEAGCFFKFDEKTSKMLTDQQRHEIEGFSTVYMTLNALRGLVSNFTANAPFGRYLLPSIDLNKLIAEKRNQVAVQQTQTDNNKTTKTKPVKKKTQQSNKSNMKK